MMKIEEILEKIGLKDKEPKIYLELAKLPGFHPASVIAGRAGINRTTVYKVLVSLAKNGIVTKSMKYGVLSFSAEDPIEKLNNLLKKKEENLKTIKTGLDLIIPDLEKIRSQVQLSSPKMRFYEGTEGVRKVYEDTLKTGETIYAFEDTNETLKELYAWLNGIYVPKRVKKNIYAYVLTPKNKSNIKYRKNDKKGYRETRFIPTDVFPIETEIDIYGDKVAFISHKDHEIFATIIESKSISNSMRAIFNINWMTAK